MPPVHKRLIKFPHKIYVKGSVIIQSRNVVSLHNNQVQYKGGISFSKLNFSLKMA